MTDRFGPAFRAELIDLMRWRRDTRRFRIDPVEAAVIDRCLSAFVLAPSVGLSEPWRIIRVETATARAACLANFRDANEAALVGYCGETARTYANLKLSGMAEAPVQLAVFCDASTGKGAGLGAMSMPETRAYSVVAAITHLWLAARAEGLGLGWVSILDPDRLACDLQVSQDWRLIGYLCIGWPEGESLVPELEMAGWEVRSANLWMEQR